MARIWPFHRASRASVFSVHEPPGSGGTALERAERLVFIREGFSWRAALFGPFYLLMKREWVGLALYIAAAVTTVNLLGLAGAETHWISWAVVLLNVITGFEASEVQRWSLARAGWRDHGIVSGSTPEEAERRFFEAWLPTASAHEPAAAPRTEPPPGPGVPPHHDAVSRAESLLHRLSARLSGKSATGT